MGGVKNLQVVDPTISTLTVRWDPAVGNVQSYKVFYTGQPDGEEQMVGIDQCSCAGYYGLSAACKRFNTARLLRLSRHSHCNLMKWLLCCTGGGVRRQHLRHPQEPGL